MYLFSLITAAGIEVEEIWYHDNSRKTSGILCQDFSKCLPLGPLYQVTRGKHRIEDHISHIKKKHCGNYFITSHLAV
jgi:hypothetical protein